MASLLPDFEYDVFVSYRQKDNEYDGWVTEFVENLKHELRATFKEEITIYFDKNPNDGLLATHQVSESLHHKLNCAVFIPIVSQTYCDPNSYAWSTEFIPFVKQASEDKFGLNVQVKHGNVYSRVLPIKIHELDTKDQAMFEQITGGIMRAIEFIYKSDGVNRPLRPKADEPEQNTYHTVYRDQINKVANAIKEIITGLKNSGTSPPPQIEKKEVNSSSPSDKTPKTKKKKSLLYFSIGALIVLLAAYFIFRSDYEDVLSEKSNLAIVDKSIAVLPFTNMSSDKEQDYFCDGIAEDILNDLTQLEGLHVVARTSSFAFKDKNQDIREIGLKLGVQTIVEGSVRKIGNSLRITVQLINVADGYHLWSQRYDRDLEDVFAIQSEIAKHIVQALEIKLSSREKLIFGKTKTQDVQAYDFYIRGRDYFHQAHEDKILLAIPMFRKAIQKDKNYALAYTGLADSYSHIYMYFNNNNQNLKQALNASKKALELDSELAEAHSSRGIALAQNREYKEAEKEFETAIQLNPKLFDPYYEYGRICRVQGKHDQAAKLFEKAVQIEPDNYHPIMFLTSAYDDLNMEAETYKANQRALEVFRKHLDLNPDDARALYLGAGALIRAEEPEEALVWVKKAILLEPNEISVLYNAACIYSLLGKVDEAIDYFEKAIESGFASRDWIENDSDLDPIRDHPRFIEILEKMN